MLGFAWDWIIQAALYKRPISEVKLDAEMSYGSLQHLSGIL